MMTLPFAASHSTTDGPPHFTWSKGSWKAHFQIQQQIENIIQREMIPANSPAHFMAMIGCCKEQRRLTASDATPSPALPSSRTLTFACDMQTLQSGGFGILHLAVRNNTYICFVVQYVNEKVRFRRHKEEMEANSNDAKPP